MTMARMKRHSTSDSMDDWLDSQGFYRKHVAKDGSCLFRAVAEQVFDAQVFHTNVRECCVNYLDRNRELFVEFIDGSFDTHLENMKNPNEFAGQVEMSALSLLLKRDILVFHEVGKQPFNVTDNGYEEKIMLYLSQGNHYDSVFHKKEISDAAMSQSLIYEILYKRVFRMGDEVDLAVEKMLHDKAYAKMRKDSTASMDSNWCSELLDNAVSTSELGVDNDNDDDDQPKDPASEIRRALAQGYPPFPYKVAKALDPQIYRNVEFDVWNEAQKDLTIFEPGVKCLVRLDKEKQESYHAHIQEVSPDKGPVTVYIVELGKKQTVPYDSLEPLPAYNKSWQTFGVKSYKAVASYYHKPHVNNGILDLDKYKGKKRVYKKGKYKDVTFSMPLPCGGQGPPPRLHHPQSQFDTSIFPLGRGRIPYQAIPRNPSPHMKWISPVHSNNQRYRQKSGNGGRYYVSSMGFGHDSQVRMYDQRSGYDHNQPRDQNHQREPVPLLKNCGSTVPPMPWSKGGSRNAFHQRESPGCHNQSGSDMDRSLSNPTRTNGDAEVSSTPNNAISGSPVSLENSAAVQAPPLSLSMPTYTSTSACTQGSILSIPPVPQNGVATGGVPQSPTTTATSSSSEPSPSGQPLMASTPTHHHQLTLYPCHYYSGVYVPYEQPQLPVNFSAMRSQDPSGADLPLQDLSTLRFFFNLGCDYFRMSTVVQVPPTPGQYGMWNYGNGQGYNQTFNGYLTPLSNSDCYETTEGSVSASCSTGSAAANGMSPADDPAASQLPEEVYDAPTYIYSSSPVNFVPATIYHPSLDYCSAPPMAGLLGEFKNGLVLNEQGMLSLGTPPPPPPGGYCGTPTSGLHQTNSRHRSDSASSNLSQHSTNQDWNRPGSSSQHGYELQHGHLDTRYYPEGSYTDHGGRHNGGSAAYSNNGNSTTYSNNGGSVTYPTNGASTTYSTNSGATVYCGNGNGAIATSNNTGATPDCNGGNGNNVGYAEGSQNGELSNYVGGNGGGNGNGNANGGCGGYTAGSAPGCYPGNSHRHSATTRGGGATGSIPPRFQHQRRNVSPGKQQSPSSSYHHQHSGQYGGGARPPSMVSTAAYPLVPTGAPLVGTPPPPLNGAGAYQGGGSASHPSVMAATPSTSYYQHHPSAVMYPTTTHPQQQQQQPPPPQPYFPASS